MENLMCYFYLFLFIFIYTCSLHLLPLDPLKSHEAKETYIAWKSLSVIVKKPFLVA